jgi:hypothetical protein
LAQLGFRFGKPDRAGLPRAGEDGRQQVFVFEWPLLDFIEL